MSERMDDDGCRRLGAILGDGLAGQLRNAEYLASRGPGYQDQVYNLRRATELRVLDPARPAEPATEGDAHD